MNVLNQHRTPNLIEVILMGILAGMLLIIAGSLLSFLSGCAAPARTEITGATSNVSAVTTTHTLAVSRDATPRPALCQTTRVLAAPSTPPETVYKVRFIPLQPQD